MDLGRCLFCTDCVQVSQSVQYSRNTGWRRERGTCVYDGRTLKLAEAPEKTAAVRAVASCR
jgi:hypothetical protein